MTQKIGGILFSDAGQMQSLNGAAGVPAGASFLGGWAVNTTGEPYVEDLGAGAVPAGSVFLGAIAHHPDGRLYVTTDAPSGSQFIGGKAVRPDGALHTSAAAVGVSDAFHGGWAIASTGAARMVIV